MRLFNREKKQLFNEFDSRNHLRPRINKADFYQLTGFDFGWLLLEPISIAKSPEDELKISKQLSAGQKALYFWWYLDGEVTNGGFVQFYYNGREKYVSAIIKGLELIQDKKMSDLVNKAQQIYTKNKKVFERAWATDSFGSELYEELTELSQLDDVYYSLNNQTMFLIERYAKQHPFEFCLDEDGKEFKQDYTGIVTSYFKNEKVKDKFTLAKGIIDGEFISYYENGKEKSLNAYENGEQVGEQKIWYEDGTLKSKITIDNRTRQKNKEDFYPNGQIQKLETMDKNGEKKGVCKEWYDNGQLKEQAEFVGSIERIGPWLKFYKDGNPKLQAEFKNGEVFFHNYWNEQGEQLLKNGTGLYINEFDTNMLGQAVTYKYETEFKSYKRNGISKSFYNGVIQSVQEFKDGLEDGKIESYEEGKLTEIKIYDKGKLISTEKIE